MVSLLMALKIRIPYMFDELGFRVVLIYEGKSQTSQLDFYREEDGELVDAYAELHDLVLSFIDGTNRGSWPFEPKPDQP